ncbi:mechanosensitive ion channel family protein [Ferrimicrobium acidiphilum]|uniref:Miniconductance mechanosensitive channel MscM n=1 Tax=Ferrimicrobium acidiphilum DSM 19497 TaxID=1121877 RepID=A0A0D8FUT0_9ACTN|nr:mechanosensitive ion channel domain-containing protein [Ferrimicrobium acidiphilum]KJE76861.1 miniconductance mechanosensitive channel MscM precursor [Ferrimicrobium acidiphilum DSM 19497]MCL5053182.1 mechanosensitive ion channel [Gammaproteobacteria bacterium]
MSNLFQQYVKALPALLVALVVGIAIAFAVIRLTRWVNARHPNSVRTAALRRLRGPVRALVPLLLMIASLHYVKASVSAEMDIRHAIWILLIAVVAWGLARLVESIEDAVLYYYHIDAVDNLKARRLQTQIRVFRRIIVVVIALIALAVILFSFPSVRLVGAGVLASAGILTIIAGIAVQPVASNVIAGIQIAVSQPIRLDDVVVIQGHWGRVEEISLTYVVVRIWDLRRLVLPISYFITNPFENWTKTTSDILGIVHIELDYTAPVAAIREQYLAILASSPDWDGSVARMQVTQLGVSTMQLRFVMSSPDSSRSWNLECELREKMILFLQEKYPEVLPRVRAEMVPSSLKFAPKDPSADEFTKVADGLADPRSAYLFNESTMATGAQRSSSRSKS